MSSRRRPTIVEDPPTIDRPPGREVLGSVERNLPVPLTPDEVHDRAAEVAVRVGQLWSLRWDAEVADKAAKDAKKERAEAVKAAEKELDNLSRSVRNRSEDRPVACEEILDWTKKIVEVSRIDTGAIVGTRSITDGDRQTTLARERRDRDPEAGT